MLQWCWSLQRCAHLWRAICLCSIQQCSDAIIHFGVHCIFANDYPQLLEGSFVLACAPHGLFGWTLLCSITGVWCLSGQLCHKLALHCLFTFVSPCGKATANNWMCACVCSGGGRLLHYGNNNGKWKYTAPHTNDDQCLCLSDCLSRDLSTLILCMVNGKLNLCPFVELPSLCVSQQNNLPKKMQLRAPDYRSPFTRLLVLKSHL